MMLWTLTPPQYRTFLIKKTFILEQSELPIAKDIGPFSRRCNARHRQTFYDFGNVLFSTLEASVFMGKNYSDYLHSIKNTGENLTLKLMFEISEQLILGQSDGIFWSVSNQLGKFSMETVTMRPETNSNDFAGFWN